MSWENRSGGRGPWGQSPSGGGGRGDGPQPPDLQELFKRGKDRLRGVLPPGGLKPGLVGLIALVVIGGWLATGFYSVQPNEQGLVLRFGAYDRTTTQGLNYALPWPVETVEILKVTNENQINIGFRTDQEIRREGPSAVPEESLMLTGDENIVDISFSVVWVIRDALQFRFTLVEQDAAIRAVAEAAMREVVGRSRVQEVLTQNRVLIQDDVHKLMQSVLDSYGAGVEILRVQIQKAEVPAEVIKAFRDVQAAKTEADTFRNEAQAHANKVVPEARGAAEKLIQEAEAYKASEVAAATGEAQRFLSILTEYSKAPEVTRRRLYFEMMEDVLRGVNKVVIDEKGGTGVLPYLPLDQLMRRGGANTPTPRGSQ